ncbi:uroporphyrinogen decarboxylase family protein [Marinilabilia rubra]|uniref:Methyltransferase n=1 Tax=Marinilabilia rubra TaxID=2162893 RepID=A0A2U2BC06_9BACT|nr:uroporphyrinogen decarboxylase family protein [Marinilabilia rubra]PWE00591.1 methyltransferase [Marinilabilia rubra]
MNSRERLIQTLNHEQPDRIVFDMGSTPTTGIHVRTLEKLREYYGLEKRPIRVIEPYQMLGLVEQDLMDAIGIDVTAAWGDGNLFGYRNTPPLKGVKTFWGQEVLVPQGFSTKTDEKGDLLSFPMGDESLAPSAKMPQSGYFFDAIERQKTIVEEELKAEDNLEEFTPVSDETLAFWKKETALARATNKGVVAALGGTALGDIALIPGMNLADPKGIRSVAEWYMSTLMRSDLIKEVFDRQSELAIENLRRFDAEIGDNIDVIYICGADFGTQDSTFCAPEQFADIWVPYYQRINNWIHENTPWKTFKHSCGAVETFMSHFIDSGFDIINPVQVNAAGMDPKFLKEKYGKHLTFWGGGVDTQKTLPYGKPVEVREEVLRHCEIFAKDGGFVFNTVHNIQADVPIDNLVAMINAIHEFNG